MNKIIEQHFTKENLVKNITAYVLYYQIALGRNVYESLQDKQETIDKLNEINLSLTPNDVIAQLLDMILVLKQEEDLSRNFEKYIQIKALLHSLTDFVNSDNELLNKQNYFEKKQEDILAEKFFDTNMKMQYLKEYPDMLKHYEKVIDDEYIEQITKILKKSLSGH